MNDVAIRSRRVPGVDPARAGTSQERSQGPLPLLLIGLTVVTGLVDAFSYLCLGHVFVANMTGNVVFLGFALSGAGAISIVAHVPERAAPAAGRRPTPPGSR